MANSNLHHNHHPEYLHPSLPSDFLPPVSRIVGLVDRSNDFRDGKILDVLQESLLILLEYLVTLTFLLLRVLSNQT